MDQDFSVGQDNLRKLIAWRDEHRADIEKNEATTRLHLIDRLLFECLGWDRKDCCCEERLKGEKQRSDYTLSAPHRLLIVEAKKEGVYFTLPAGVDKLIYPISFFAKHHPDVFEAIGQAVDYCQHRGTAFGAVSNGLQVIAFIGSRTDGMPPLEGKSLVFGSLTFLDANFLVGWQCLSKPGIQSFNLAVKLQAEGVTPPPEKLSRWVVDYPGYKNRNKLQNDFEVLAELAVVEKPQKKHEEEFLQHCYCESRALSQYALLTNTILKTRYSTTFEKAVGGPTLAQAVTPAGVSKDFLADSLSARPTLLLGDVGAGKTIFISHLMKVNSPEVRENSLVFYVDFGVKPTLMNELRPYLLRELTDQLLNTHGIDTEEGGFIRGVYHKDLARFARGLHGELKESDPPEFRRKEREYLEQKVADREAHLYASLEHISKGRDKHIIIVLDNIDQREYRFQQEVFLIAQSLAETWPTMVFVSLRPGTYYHSRTEGGAMSAYSPRVFTITPPPVDQVIGKRLEFSLRLLDRGQLAGLAGQTVELSSLHEYLQVLLHSFRHREELIEFIDNICGGDIRLAISFVRAFIGSGHVDSEDILTKNRNSGPYLIPLHQFLRAVIYRDHEYFNPKTSDFVNVFDVCSADGREHFLMLLLLGDLEAWAASGRTSDGFRPSASIFQFAQNIGFQPFQVEFAIRRALSKKLIEAHTKEADWNEDRVYKFRITTVGAYYLKKLSGSFTYVDAMIPDTPIIDSVSSAGIREVYPIRERVQRSRIFCEYMDKQWHVFEKIALPFDWKRVAGMLRSHMEGVERSLRDRQAKWHLEDFE